MSGYRWMIVDIIVKCFIWKIYSVDFQMFVLYKTIPKMKFSSHIDHYLIDCEVPSIETTRRSSILDKHFIFY
jgi:hypothetical protein